MKLLIDEDVDRSIINWLGATGHDVVSIFQVSPGASDHDVALRSTNEGRCLITRDRHFGDIIMRGDARPPGVLYLRIRARTKQARLLAFQKSWPVVEDQLIGNLTVVAIGRVRVRPLVFDD